VGSQNPKWWTISYGKYYKLRSFEPSWIRYIELLFYAGYNAAIFFKIYLFVLKILSYFELHEKKNLNLTYDLEHKWIYFETDSGIVFSVKKYFEMIGPIIPFTKKKLNPIWRIQNGGRKCEFGVNLVITIQQ
jgi:hypothetical protein